MALNRSIARPTTLEEQRATLLENLSPGRRAAIENFLDQKLGDYRLKHLPPETHDEIVAFIADKVGLAEKKTGKK